jgi:mannose-1-phosphate guanylyltransferase
MKIVPVILSGGSGMRLWPLSFLKKKLSLLKIGNFSDQKSEKVIILGHNFF